MWRVLEGGFSKRDPEFEPAFLQRRVKCEPDFLDQVQDESARCNIGWHSAMPAAITSRFRSLFPDTRPPMILFCNTLS